MRGRLPTAHVLERALLLAVEHDDCIQLLERLVAYCPSSFTAKGAEEAAYLGNLQALQWLFEASLAISMYISVFVSMSAYGGHLHVR